MAKLAKEGTTVRRVLESLFRYFDTANLWSPEHGLALAVLLNMQSIIENSGIYFLVCFNISLFISISFPYFNNFVIGFIVIYRTKYTLVTVHFSQAP